MKRFHVHVHVDDLSKNIAFYSAMFNQAPARTEGDYAKWMLQDPPVNFAISTRGAQPGLDHLGIQVETDDELQTLKTQAAQAGMAMLDEGETTCCYARSDKYWITDPQGIAWEQFHTLDNIPVFRESSTVPASACCTPAAKETAESSCCSPAQTSCCPPASTSATSCCAPTAQQTANGAKACC